jgi:signal transduction histidine kinase
MTPHPHADAAATADPPPAVAGAHPVADPAPPATPGPAARPGRKVLRGNLRYIGSLLAVATGIALFLAAVFGQDLWRTWQYTVFITAGCAGAIQGSLWLAVRLTGERRPGWPSWPWTVLAIGAGTVVGYTAGNLVANWVTGLQAPTLLAGVSRQTLVPLLIALVPGAGITWYFHTRERLAAAEAQAQAAQRLAAENQLRLLQSQLEPHMLFNTLANLRVLIGVDPAQAQAMLDRLIAFLRATLNASRRPLHPLSEEFARVDDYLVLMAVRMGERLQVRLDLPADLAATPVPPLLLQPLVENGIKHGLEPQVAGGRIEVGAARVDGVLRLTVRDTGVGLGAAAADGTRFGLAQVRERLRTLYGAAAELRIAPAADADGGTLVTLTLPLP